MKAIRSDKNNLTDTDYAAYSVLTLTLEVTYDDRGDFLCVLETSDGTVTSNKTIHLDVLSNGRTY